jgi:Tfp pilus assembly protein PilV
MFLRRLQTNDQGFTFIEILIGLVSIAIIALALQSFITGNLRTNEHIINETDTLVAANIVFDKITEALKCGSDFNCSDEGKTLTFTTDAFNAAGQEITATVSWNGKDITLTRTDSPPRTLNSARDRIQNLRFETPNQYNVLIRITINGNIYTTTIRGLNQFDK